MRRTVAKVGPQSNPFQSDIWVRLLSGVEQLCHNYPMPDSANRKTILILTLSISLVVALLALIAQEDLREKLGSAFYVVGLAIIGCVLLVLAGYIWDRTLTEKLRSLRDSSMAGSREETHSEDTDHDEIIGLARNIERMAKSLQKWKPVTAESWRIRWT
jgi:hypothetical protein